MQAGYHIRIMRAVAGGQRFDFISLRTDYCNVFEVFRQREGVVLIFQKNDRFAGGTQRHFPVLVAVYDLIGKFGVFYIRIVEKS